MSRPRVLLVPLLSLVVGLALVVLPAAGAQAEPATTQVTLNLSRLVHQSDGSTTLRKATYGVFWDGVGPAIDEDTFYARGRLTSGTAGVADQQVTLFRTLKTSDTPQLVDTATTAADGSYRFTNAQAVERRQRVVGGGTYYVTFTGDGSTYSDATSAPVPLPSYRDFNARLRRGDGKIFFVGDINPGWGGRTVSLLKKSCGTCAWKVVASKAAGSAGGWSFRVAYPANVGPVWRWQAVLRAAGDFDKSYSAELRTNRVYG
jgi:hypothetical protein